MNRIILGVDVGSTKICSIIADVRGSDVQIIGTGACKTQGVKKGAIVNIEQAGSAIRKSIHEAKLMAGVDVSKAIVSLSGAHTKSINVSGSANVMDREVNIDTINAALSFAVHNAGIPKDYSIVHVLPHHFRLNDKEHVEDPIGMTGSRLEVDTHIVTVQTASLENLKKAIRLAGVEIENIVLSSYAASIAVLHEDEKDLGVACIDMGAQTCELMIYDGNSMCYNDFLGVGSNHISSDMARFLNTPLKVAEEIKIKFGNLLPSAEEQNRMLEIPRIGNNEETIDVPLRDIYCVMGDRVKETLRILSDSIGTSGLKKQITGVVLTGGMANLKGMREFASAAFSPLSVRLARPTEIDGLFDNLKDSSSSVVVGLILYGAGNFTNYEKDSQNNIRSRHNALNMVESNYETQTQTMQTSSDFQIDLRDLDQPSADIPENQVGNASDSRDEKPSFLQRFKAWSRDLF